MTISLTQVTLDADFYLAIVCHSPKTEVIDIADKNVHLLGTEESQEQRRAAVAVAVRYRSFA
jgi:hypothetical protein